MNRFLVINTSGANIGIVTVVSTHENADAALIDARRHAHNAPNVGFAVAEIRVEFSGEIRLAVSTYCAASFEGV